MFIILKDGCIHVTEGATVAPRKQYPDVETAIPFHDFFQKTKACWLAFPLLTHEFTLWYTDIKVIHVSAALVSY